MKLSTFPLVLLAVLFLSSIHAYAGLVTFGTATDGNSQYNLIFDSDQNLIWLGFHSQSNWYDAMSWATGLNEVGALTYNIYPEFNVTWNGDWRLPRTFVDPSVPFSDRMSEMGLLYYDALGDPPVNLDLFNPPWDAVVWSETNYPGYDGVSYAWVFNFHHGSLYGFNKDYSGDPERDTHGFNTLAVRSGNVASVPESGSTLLFLGIGIVGVIGYGWRCDKG